MPLDAKEEDRTDAETTTVQPAVERGAEVVTESAVDGEESAAVTTTELPETTTLAAGVSPAPAKSRVLDDSGLVIFLLKRWRPGYRAAEAFGNLTDLSNKKMDKFYDKMVRGGRDGLLFRQFRKHSIVYKPWPNDTCDEECFGSVMCALVSFKHSELTECLTARGIPGSDPMPVVPTLPPADDVKESSTPFTTVSTSIVTLSSYPSGKSHDDGADKVTSVPDNHSVRGVAIGFCLVAVIAVAAAGLYVYKRVQRNKYRAQEFLLTDSVFRYDGYSMVDEP